VILAGFTWWAIQAPMPAALQNPQLLKVAGQKVTGGGVHAAK